VANVRLRKAMAMASMTVDQMSDHAGVDPKTVQRWLNGRRPHARHRWALAALLREEADYLWPPDPVAAGSGVTCTEEVVAAYAHRAHLSPTDWWRLMERAEKQIDLLGYAMLHLPEQHPDLVPCLKTKGKRGCQIRIALADPTSAEARKRDEEERLDNGLLARIRTASLYFGELTSCDGVDLRHHSTPMYNSIFRFDDHMLVTPHLYGIPGSKAPLFHLRLRGSNGLFANFARHFEAIWQETHSMEALR
jgi:transcriptional regulator with XRE-family HTH domain